MAYGTVKTDLIENSNGLTGKAFGPAFVNRIINGAMMIDQRNAGASVTLGSNSAYGVDRFYAIASSASKLSMQQSTAAPTGFINSWLLTSLAATTVGASDYYQFTQPIEGLNVADLAWGTASAKTVTLSFWVQSSLTGTFGGSLRNSAANRSYPFSYTISAANTWEQKSITISGDTTGTWLTTNGIGILVTWGLGNGSTFKGTAGTWAAANYQNATGAIDWISTNGATFYITGVQLEVGSTATSFDYRPYGTELALCQRYYYKEPDSQRRPALLDGPSGDYPKAFVYHPVEMRATPTTVFEVIDRFDYNNGSANTFFTPSGGATAYNGNTRLGSSARNAISNGAGSAQVGKVGQWLVQLSFSAEL